MKGRFPDGRSRPFHYYASNAGARIRALGFPRPYSLRSHRCGRPVGLASPVGLDQLYALGLVAELGRASDRKRDCAPAGPKGPRISQARWPAEKEHSRLRKAQSHITRSP